eukprot:3001321-Rhodomonas_salina.2
MPPDRGTTCQRPVVCRLRREPEGVPDSEAQCLGFEVADVDALHRRRHHSLLLPAAHPQEHAGSNQHSPTDTAAHARDQRRVVRGGRGRGRGRGAPRAWASAAVVALEVVVDGHLEHATSEPHSFPIACAQKHRRVPTLVFAPTAKALTPAISVKAFSFNLASSSAANTTISCSLAVAELQSVSSLRSVRREPHCSPPMSTVKRVICAVRKVDAVVER